MQASQTQFGFFKVTSNQFKSKLLTYEREDRRQQEEHAVAVHGECDDKVHGQTPKQEDGVYYRPVRHVQPQLKSHRDRTHLSPNPDKFQKQKDCAKGESSLYLDADSEQKACLCEEGEGLVVGHVLPVTPHHVIQGGVRNEEEHQRAVAAVEGALEEGRLAEVQVELAGDVELWMLEAPHVVHILTSRGRQRHAVEQKLY